MHPAVLERALGRIGQVPVTLHVRRALAHQFAHFATWQLGPVLADHLELGARHCLARAAHALVAVERVIFGREHGDGAGRLGHAVALQEACTGNGLDRLAQQIERDRRGAIHDIFDRRHVGVLRARVLDHHLQRGGHDEQSRYALLERIEHPVGGEFRLHDRADAGGDRHDAEAGPADMRAGHADEDRLVLVPARPRLRRRFGGQSQ